MKNIAIIGSGSFGCAIANELSKNKNNNIKVWSYDINEAKVINEKHKCIYLKDLKLDKRIKCYINYEEVLKDAEFVFMASPSSVIRKISKDISNYITNQKIILLSKGIEKETNKLLSDVIKEEIPNSEIGILSGPSHAEQMVKNNPTFVDFSCKNIEFYNDINNILSNETFKLKYNNDMIGTQIGGSLKNVISICLGIFEGLNYKSNTLSYIITEGLYEMKLIGLKLGAKEETIFGLSGLGDLFTTCISESSRNKKAGILLSKNKSIDNIHKELGAVIEGLENINSIYSLSKKFNLNLKIIDNLYNLIYNKISKEEFIKNIID